jgi:4-amino-4-deoxy-L-arabinose transferase-like glycosyltransferase
MLVIQTFISEGRERGWGPALARRMSWDRLALALFGLLAILIAGTYNDYGVTWDEDVHNYYGKLVLAYYASWFQDKSALSWWNLYLYGGAFDLIAALVNKVSPLGEYETRHLINSIVGMAGVFGCWKLTRTLAGSRAALFAALMLLLAPAYYGHSYNNPKDIPFAAACIWALYYLVRMVPALPRPPLRLVLKFGVAAGLALGVRVGGLLYFCYLGLIAAAFVGWGLWESRDLRHALRQSTTIALRVLVPALIVAYPVMLLFWPWAQEAPVTHPLEALAEFSHHAFPWKTLFAGEYYDQADLPRSYLPVHILLILPELVVILGLGALTWGAAMIWRRDHASDRPRLLGYLIVCVAAIFPIAYAVAIKAVLFDGMRHFLFVVPPIACIAAIMLDRIIDYPKALVAQRALVTLLAAYGLYHASIMVRLHPNQYIYYNEFIGGTDNAAGYFKIDYWANSYAETVEKLETYLRDQYGEDFDTMTFRIKVCGPPVPASYYFPANFKMTDNDREAEFFVSFTNEECHKSLAGTEVVRVERLGTLLSVAIDRRAIVHGLATAFRL